MTNKKRVEQEIERLVWLVEKDFLSLYSNNKNTSDFQREIEPLHKEHTNILNTIQKALENARVEICQEGVFFILGRLDLSSHQMNKQILQIVCSFLGNDQLLVDSLSLSQNLFCSDIDSLIDYLEGNKSVRRLDLSNNHLGPLVLNKFAVLLKNNNQTLEEINFDSSRLGTESFLLLTRLLIGNKTLKKFSALNNFDKCNSDVLLHLHQLIKNNRSLVELKISDPKDFNEEEILVWKKITSIFEKNKRNHKKINQEKRVNKLLSIHRKKLKRKIRLEKLQSRRKKNENIQNKSQFLSEKNEGKSVVYKPRKFTKQLPPVTKKEKIRAKEIIVIGEKAIAERNEKISFKRKDNKKTITRLSSGVKEYVEKNDEEGFTIIEEEEKKLTKNKKKEEFAFENVLNTYDYIEEEMNEDQFNKNDQNKETIFIEEWEKNGFEVDTDEYQKFEEQNNRHINRLLRSSNNFKKIYSFSFPNKKIN
ncbi:leucine rich repeat family protein [Anaeramoeba flamelloides]|uniref:Leucine rich repeat family protein n=1 Tax=Anaeramoeba flamelloides TaxID=1746091 RepID=A0ABQ8YKE3_9EUKA|nr:leucine rich repeat family protein [Anaeramoeba flamelloides]